MLCFLKCSVINSRYCSVNLYYCCRVTETVWKKYLEVLESSEKVLEFRVSNIVGTLIIVEILQCTALHMGSSITEWCCPSSVCPVWAHKSRREAHRNYKLREIYFPIAGNRHSTFGLKDES